jgi:hypothetical protein
MFRSVRRTLGNFQMVDAIRCHSLTGMVSAIAMLVHRDKPT